MENYIGTIIKNIRQSKGVTQKELAYKLCSVKQISRIERNMSSPTSYLISEISSRLGNELLDYLPYTDDPNAYHVKNELDQVMMYFRKHQYNTVLEMLENSADLNDVKSRYAKQEIAWLYGAISNYVEVPFEIDESYYKDLLLSNYTSKTIDDIFDVPMRSLDYRILNSLIVLYLKKGNQDYAELLMIRAIENIENTQSNIREVSYLRFIYNLSRLYLKLFRYQKAIHYSKKGIEFCIENGSLTYLADLSNIHGRSLYEFGKKDEFERYIDTYIVLSRLTKPEVDFEKKIEYLKDEYRK